MTDFNFWIVGIQVSRHSTRENERETSRENERETMDWGEYRHVNMNLVFLYTMLLQKTFQKKKKDCAQMATFIRWGEISFN